MTKCKCKYITITQNSIRPILDLDRYRLTDNRSAENDCIVADTDTEYRIDASLVYNSAFYNDNDPLIHWHFHCISEMISVHTTQLKMHIT